MTVTIATSFAHFLRLARAEAEARMSGDRKRLAEAEAAHEAYRQLCLRADRMIIPNVRHFSSDEEYIDFLHSLINP